MTKKLKRKQPYRGIDDKGRPGWYNTDGTFTYINPDTNERFKTSREVWKYYAHNPDKNKRFDIVQLYYDKFRKRQQRAIEKAKAHDYHHYGIDSTLELYNPHSQKGDRLNGIDVEKAIIDSIAANKPKEMGIYRALTLPAIETNLGTNRNLPESEGYTRALFNDHSYEYGTIDSSGKQTTSYANALGYATRVALGVELKNLTDEIIRNKDEKYWKANDILIEDAYPSKLKKYEEHFNASLENPWKHALYLHRVDNGAAYNKGEADRTSKLDRVERELQQYPELVEYIKTKGYKKLGGTIKKRF